MAHTGENAKMPLHMTQNCGTTRPPIAGVLRTAACVLPILFSLGACSSMNPVHWFSGMFSSNVEDDPDLDKPVTASGNSRAPASGLVGDTANSDYAPAVHREVAETKPLVKPAAAPVAVVAAAPSPAQTAPSGPPSYMPSGSVPAKPNVPDTVPVPVKSSGTLLDHYHQRLRESAATSVSNPMVGFNGVVDTPVSKAVHLVPPKTAAGTVPAAGTPESSFQIASLTFSPNSNALSPSDLEALREAVRLYKSTGGYVRVLGLGVGGDSANPVMVYYSPARGNAVSAQARAEAVARELVRLGVPGAKIMVGAVAPGSQPAADGAAARVYLDM